MAHFNNKITHANQYIHSANEIMGLLLFSLPQNVNNILRTLDCRGINYYFVFVRIYCKTLFTSVIHQWLILGCFKCKLRL